MEATEIDCKVLPPSQLLSITLRHTPPGFLSMDRAQSTAALLLLLISFTHKKRSCTVVLSGLNPPQFSQKCIFSCLILAAQVSVVEWLHIHLELMFTHAWSF
uniref:Uncharacterized protein n=1 Tax=Micrurus surinamensis TaxID=129470 RepID=A0A2D4Q3G2_MICSU